MQKYRTEFISISYSGGRDIEQHLRSEKYINTDRATASNSLMLNFSKNSNAPTRIPQLSLQGLCVQINLIQF